MEKASASRVMVVVLQNVLLRRDEHQLPAGPPGLPAPIRQRRHPAGVDERQVRQVHDDLRRAGRGRCERRGDIRGVYQVKLPAQRDDNMTVAFAGAEIHPEHRGTFLLEQQGKVPAQRLVRQLPS